MILLTKIDRYNSKSMVQLIEPPVRLQLKKGDLIQHGYRLRDPQAKRRKGLRAAWNSGDFSINTLIRKMNVLAILHKNRNVDFAQRAKDDMAFLQRLRRRVERKTMRQNPNKKQGVRKTRKRK